MQAIYANTPPEPSSPWVLPGVYTVTLTVNGKKYSQPMTVKMDPRVKTSLADLQKQHALSMRCYEGRETAKNLLSEAGVFHTDLTNAIAKGGSSVGTLTSLEQQLAAFEGVSRGRGAAAQAANFGSIQAAYTGLLGILHETDMPPTTQTIAGVAQTDTQLKELQAKWTQLKKEIRAAK
jgi:aerobic-type carbon monoxide dehydrogenase small subunit (CoxS/CutS family)